MIAVTQVQAQVEAPEQTTNKNLENWYINFGIGYPSVSYPAELNWIKDIILGDDVKTTHLELDLGLYFPLQSQFTFGVSFSGFAEKFEKDGNWLKYSNYFKSVSVLYHVKSQYDGLFVRADLGSSIMNKQGKDQKKTKIQRRA